MIRLGEHKKRPRTQVGYPSPSWNDFPRGNMIRAWAEKIRQVVCSPQLDVDRVRVTGLAALVEHDYPRNVEAMARLIAQDLGVAFVRVQPDHESLPQKSHKNSGKVRSILYLEPGAWLGSPDQGSQVLSYLENNFATPDVLVVSCCRNIDDVWISLRRITGFTRLFSVSAPNAEELGECLIARCERNWIADELLNNPRRAGELLRAAYEGYEGLALAALYVQRIFLEDGRAATLRDLAHLDSVGFVETCSVLPSVDCFDERVALHEAGHAAVAMVDSGGVHIPDLVTVVPRRFTYGFMTHSRTHCERRQMAYTPAMAHHDLRLGLGGRAAEEIAYGFQHISDLSSWDMEKAATTLITCVESYGFYFGLGQASLPYLGITAHTEHSNFARLQASAEWCRVFEDLYQETLDICRSNWQLVESIKNALLTHKVLVREDLENLYKAHCSARLMDDKYQLRRVVHAA